MSLPAAAAIAFCPGCGASAHPQETLRRFHCSACDFALYFNAGASVSAIALRQDGAAAFVRRAREPRRGFLTLPGGFVDPDESAEVALRREVREEIGLELAAVRFLTAQPNAYPYRGIVYPTLDLVYVGHVVAGEERLQADEVAGLLWRDPAQVALEEMAFPSLAEAVRLYRERRFDDADAAPENLLRGIERGDQT